MTTYNTYMDTSGPGKTCQLNKLAASFLRDGIPFIFIDADSDEDDNFWLSAGLPCAVPLEGKARASQRALSDELGRCVVLVKADSGMSVILPDGIGNGKEKSNV